MLTIFLPPYYAYITLRLEWEGTYVCIDDPECWLVLFAQVYRIFVNIYILKIKNLFQILS